MRMYRTPLSRTSSGVLIISRTGRETAMPSSPITMPPKTEIVIAVFTVSFSREYSPAP